MAAPTDPGDFTSGTVAASAAVNTRFQRLYTALAVGAVDETQISSALADKVGVTAGAVVRRGKSIIAATETRTNTAYGLLTTPDRVQNVVLPTDGLIFMAYQATWQYSVASAGAAAFFLGATQVVLDVNNGLSGSAAAASSSTAAGVDHSLASYGGGLGSDLNAGTYPGDATTGQVVGQSSTVGGVQAGVCLLFAAAGTYDVSVQFKAVSGSVTAKSRKMWVWTAGF